MGGLINGLIVQAMPNKLALVVNHENITHCYYIGQERSFMICNCLFRMGGAAALMSNRCVPPSSQLTTLWVLMTAPVDPITAIRCVGLPCFCQVRY